MSSNDFMIESEGNVVAWVIMGKMEFAEVCKSVQAIQDAVRKAKQQYGEIRIIVDNFDLSQEGAAQVYTKEVADKWGELQQWFVSTLDEKDRIGVIQGGATIKMQMTRLGRSIGLDKIEQHFFVKTYEETKAAAYEYLGIKGNRLIDNRPRLIKR